jgi:U3 small nucleolar RNA-associated protein 25
LRKVVNEEDLDEDIRKRKYENTATFDDEDDEDEVDWQKPSAYNRLIGILQKTSKHQDFYKKMKLEEEGLEDQVEDIDDDDAENNEEEEKGIGRFVWYSMSF